MQSRKRRRESEELESKLAQKKYSSKNEQTARRLAEKMLTKSLVREAEQAEQELQRVVAVHNECVKNITKDVLERMETARWSFMAEYLSEKATQRRLRQELQEMDAFRAGGNVVPEEHLRHWGDELPAAADAKKYFADRHLCKKRDAEAANLVDSSYEPGSWSERISHNKDNYHNFQDRAFNFDNFEEENQCSAHQDTNYSDNDFRTQFDERHRNSRMNKNIKRNFQNISPQRRIDDYRIKCPRTDFSLNESKDNSFQTSILKPQEGFVSPNKCRKHQYNGNNKNSFINDTHCHSLLSDQRNEDVPTDLKPECHLQSCDSGNECLKTRHDLWYEETRKKIQGCRIDDAHHCSGSAVPRHNFSESTSPGRERLLFCDCRADCKSGVSESADDRCDRFSDQPALVRPTRCWKGISRRIYEDAGIMGMSTKAQETQTSNCPKREVIEARRFTSVGERDAGPQRALENPDRCLLALINARDALVEEMSLADAAAERRPAGAIKERLAAIAALNRQIRSFLIGEHDYR